MNRLELRFSALLENVAFARTSVASFISSLNPTIDEIQEVKTIVSEGISNAIIHGYKLNGSRDVFIKVYIKKRKVEIIIQDYGIGIKNLDEALSPSFSTNKENEQDNTYRDIDLPLFGRFGRRRSSDSIS
jgi:stage II sporulation protein AB (anti-sigma F factor)